MTDITILPSKLVGQVEVPPSKSDVHRAIICAALAKGRSVISPVAYSQDILATLDCIRAMGADAQINEDSVVIDGTNTFKNGSKEFFCRESGSTVRFFIPLASAGGLSAVFSGEGRLPMRPLDVYSELLPKHGVSCKTQGGLPFEISGKLQSGTFDVTGSISSQFITGLMFALSTLDGDSIIHLTSPLQSKGYIDMTINVMRRFGVIVEERDGDYYIKGGQKYTPCEYRTEGDWSQAAFFLTAGALGGDVTVKGLRQDSAQGDKEIAGLLKRFGADVEVLEDGVRCKANELCGIEIDASQIPDLVPILSVCGAFANGRTRIYNAQRVRLKESDRLAAMKNALSNVGADIEETDDGLLINGKASVQGGFSDGCNDHRIVMSMAVAALRSENGVTVSDSESIKKSYDNFFEDYRSVGGKTK